jgi:queuine/archaeosine tRNA-ribosyltransferase
MRRVRQSIRSGDFTNFRREFTEGLNAYEQDKALSNT